MLRANRRGVALLVVLWVFSAVLILLLASIRALQVARWESRARWMSLVLDLAAVEVARAAAMRGCGRPDALVSVPILTTNRLVGRVEVEPIAAELFRLRWGIGDGYGWREGAVWARSATPLQPGPSDACAPGEGLTPLPGLPTAP